MKNLILLTFAGLVVSGCTIHRFPMTNAPVYSEPVYNRTHHSAGFHDTQALDPVAICGAADNIALVETEVLTYQGFLRFLTANIYRPYTVRVYCKNSPFASNHFSTYAKQQNAAAARNTRQPQPAYQPAQVYQGGYAQQGYYQPQQGYVVR